ncbi:recombinase family protein [Cellulosimicrobium funkei]|uniref:recombinase family protein n=1 Tax=Cellulosimicrobium funkei TaxID=264251 RepID=UPI0036594992
MRPNLRVVPDRPLRAVLYLRQSKTREDSISIELQEASCREYAARMGYEVVDVLSDPGISGRTWDRPAVKRSLAMVEARDADVIVVWKWSRLARNRRDWAVAVDKIEVAGGRLESSTETVDTTTSTGRFTRGMLAEMAAFESDRIGDTWRETHARRRGLGLPHNGSPRLGYTYDAATKSYSPDPETADVVRELYRRYVDGAGLGALSKWLRDLGIESPRSRKPWTHRGIAYFLTSGFAAGYLRVHDPACTERHQVTRDCPRHVYVDGAHEAILDEATWRATLDARESRKTLAPRLVSAVSAISGVPRCGACGHRMALHRQKDQSPRMRCANRECVAPASILYSRVEAALLGWLPTVGQLVDEHAASASTRTAAEDVERACLLRVHDEAERALGRLTVDRARGIVPESAYVAARDHLEAEQREARESLRKYERAALTADYTTIAMKLLEDWDELSPPDISRTLRDLAVAVVTRREGRRGADVTVRGVWEGHDE